MMFIASFRLGLNLINAPSLFCTKRSLRSDLDLSLNSCRSLRSDFSEQPQPLVILQLLGFINCLNFAIKLNE